MSCADMAALLHGMLDGELDAVNAVQFERHIAGCDACAAEYRRQKELRAAIRRPDLFHRAPEHLRRAIEDALPSGVARRTEAAPWWRRLFSDWRLGAGTSLALAASLALLIVTTGNNDGLQQELIAGHIRSLQASHLTDVATSDQHTVKPWFNGKLDVSPPVVDLADGGFPLAGGRLDYIDGRAVAVLVYRRHLHVINLFVWSDPGAADAPPRESSHRGYNLIHWTRGEISFWAVSELNLGELREFEVMYTGRTSP
jgi:anti-sigma factor (TIGR02949 family)